VAAAGAFAGAAFGGWDSVWVQWRKRRTRENEKEISCFILFEFFWGFVDLGAVKRNANATMQVLLVQVFNVSRRG
jgi:hypothetical protein